MSKRKSDIIFLNIIFCLIVIFIHVSSEVIYMMPKGTQFFKTVFSAQKLSSFVVQGFILLSGVKLFLNKSNGFDPAKYYASRFVRLIIPYVLWAIVYYIYFCSVGVYSFSGTDMLWRIVCGDIWAHFYFVIVLVQFELLAPLWVFMYKRGNPAVHIAFASIVTAICAQYLPAVLTTMFPYMPNFDVSDCFLRYQLYWTAGCLIGANYESFVRYLKNNKLTITLAFLICGGIYVWLALVTVGHEPVWLELFNILYSMSAISFFYMLSQLFSGRGGKALKLLSPIDRSTYTIYLVHCLFVVMVNDYMSYRGISDIPQRFGLRALAVYGASLLLGCLWQLVKALLAKLLGKGRGREIV